MTLNQRIGRALARAFGYHYEASRITREHRHPIGATAQDSKLDASDADRTMLLKLSRYLCSNVGLVRGAIADLARYSVGTGIVPQAATQSEEWNTAAENFFAQWSLAPDVTGKHTFGEIQRLACEAIDRDGEIFILKIKGGRLQLVEAHRVGDPTFSVQKDPSFFDGVFFDKNGRPTKYRVASGSWENMVVQGQSRPTTVDIDAESILHIGEPFRPDEVRHVTKLAPVINNMRAVQEVVAFERLAAKLNSALALAIESPHDVAAGGFLGAASRIQYEGSPSQELTFEEIIGGGAIPRLKPGEKLLVHKADRPADSTMRLLQFLIRDLAACLGVPYEFIWDASALGGAVQRFVLAKAGRRFEQRQRLLVQKLCQPVWEYVIGSAIAEGRLPENAEFAKVRWQGPANITVDSGRDAAQDREDLKLGLTTLAELYSSRGEDWQGAIRQKIREAAYVKAEAEAAQIDIRDVMMLTPNEQAGGDATQGGENLASQALNGAQVASLIQVINSVAAGAISREGAASIITSAFPLISQEEAASIISGVNIGVIAPANKEPSVTPESPAAAEPAPGLSEKKKRGKK